MLQAGALARQLSSLHELSCDLEQGWGHASAAAGEQEAALQARVGGHAGAGVCGAVGWVGEHVLCGIVTCAPSSGAALGSCQRLCWHAHRVFKQR
jgi:hypothetical protein